MNPRSSRGRPTAGQPAAPSAAVTGGPARAHLTSALTTAYSARANPPTFVDHVVDTTTSASTPSDVIALFGQRKTARIQPTARVSAVWSDDESHMDVPAAVISLTPGAGGSTAASAQDTAKATERVLAESARVVGEAVADQAGLLLGDLNLIKRMNVVAKDRVLRASIAVQDAVAQWHHVCFLEQQLRGKMEALDELASRVERLHARATLLERTVDRAAARRPGAATAASGPARRGLGG
ncbi:hypothetical protein GGF31_000051 [Allomyces arbusculus]|nr:hypothetical protein GGF31_000051 [Allomyces arbusculus]